MQGTEPTLWAVRSTGLLLIEAPASRGGDLRRCSTQPPQCSGGIALPARSLDVGLWNQDGASVVPRHLPTTPEAWRKTRAPARDPMVRAVDWLCTWSWRADRWAQAGRPLVLGPARSMQAIPGGHATHATSEAHTSAVRRRGGRVPPADVEPSARRATRARRRRRIQRRRHRAERLTPVQPTPCPSPLPDLGPTIAYTAHRAGGAERCPAPAGPQRLAVDRARSADDAPRLRDLEGALGTRAQPPDAHTRDWLQTLPDVGTSRRRMRWSEGQDLARVPRVQAVGSYGRVVTCAKASAGQRSGPSGTASGHASLPWAFSAAAVLCRRTHPAGHTYRARLETTHGQGQARMGLAPPLARPVSDRLPRGPACTMAPWRPGEASGAGAPAAERGHQGAA
jgi:hypothetical protein